RSNGGTSADRFDPVPAGAETEAKPVARNPRRWSVFDIMDGPPCIPGIRLMGNRGSATVVQRVRKRVSRQLAPSARPRAVLWPRLRAFRPAGMGERFVRLPTPRHGAC